MINLREAYDHIDRTMLFSVLGIRMKAPKLINILKSLYTGTKASIKNTIDNFEVHTGYRQGGIESPALFNIYTDFVLRCVEQEVLLKYSQTGLKYSIQEESSIRERMKDCERLLYADHSVLFCEDVNELNNILTIYNETTSRFDFIIAIDKHRLSHSMFQKMS